VIGAPSSHDCRSWGGEQDLIDVRATAIEKVAHFNERVSILRS
jgi:hypothetical protein